MSWGVALRNAVGLGLGGIPSLRNAPSLRATLDFNFLSGLLDPRITFSRTSNATLIGSDGTLQYAPHNLLTYSEQFDNAAWTKAQSTISANSIAAPDGTATADKLVEDATNSQHVLFRSTSIVANTPFAASGYFKAGERTRINFRLLNGTFNSGANVTFDLSAGTTPFSSLVGTATNLLFSITPVGDGWYRCAVSCVVDTTSTTGVWAAYLVNTGNNDTYLGDGTSGIYVWGAQLNVGALQPYYSTTVKNLLGYSQEFNDAAWSKSNSTVTADVTAAPDGSMTADKLVEDTAATIGHYVTPSSPGALALGQVVTYSAYAKAAERTFLQLILTSVGPAASNLVAGFDLTTGTAGTPSAGSTSSIVAAGNGWYRCSITVPVATAGTPTRQIRISQNSSSTPSSYTGDGTSGIYVWGAQLSDSASLDPYVYNPAAAPSNTAYYGPRFDYDPVTLAAKGLLIEEQRTNSIRNNTRQGAVAGTPGTLPTNWFIGNLAGLSTQVVAIGTESGVSYIDLRIFGTSTTTNFILNFEPTTQIPALQNQSWTGSFFVTYVAGTLTNVQNFSTTITERDSAGALLSTSTALRNLTNTPLIQNRYVNSYTLPTATAAYVTLRLDVGVAATSAIDITLRIGLPQLELGAFATSVIPTTTAAATRAADVASMTGANFSNWFNAVEGTTLVEAATLPNLTATVITYAISDGTFNQSIYGTFSTGNTYRGANVLDGGVAQANLIANFTGLTTTNNTKDAFAYKLNDFAESCNGVATRTDTAGTVPAVNRLYIGSSWSGNSNFLNGYIRSFKYYPTRLSNSQLQSLTFVPPTLWTPAQIPTAVWLDAADASTITLNGSTVSQWADKSGNGRNVVQATASAQPTSGTRTLNSLNTLDFDGNDWLRYNTPFLTINTEWLLYSVIIFDSLTNGPVYVGVKGAQTTHMGWALSPGNTAIYNDVIGTKSLSDAGVVSINNAAIMGVQYNTTNITGIFNGTTQLSPAATLTADTANFVVGTHSNTATNFLDGAFGEIVFIQSSVSLSNRQKLEGYLAWKWGLQANLPVGHPYKAAAPTV